MVRANAIVCLSDGDLRFGRDDRAVSLARLARDDAKAKTLLNDTLASVKHKLGLIGAT